MLIYKPQDGTTLPNAARAAIKIAKVVHNTTRYGFLELHYNDFIFGINEHTSVESVIIEFLKKIKYKYCIQGGPITNYMLQYEDWIENYVEMVDG